MISVARININNITAFLMIIGLAFILSSCSDHPQDNEVNNDKKDSTVTSTNLQTAPEGPSWVAPDTSSIPKGKDGDMIRYGRDLVANTAKYFGPKGKVNHSANGMNCQNCH